MHLGLNSMLYTRKEEKLKIKKSKAILHTQKVLISTN